MTDEETIVFQERPFTCPYCGQETMVQVPLQIDEIVVALVDCEHCGKEFLIENDEPRVRPQ